MLIAVSVSPEIRLHSYSRFTGKPWLTQPTPTSIRTIQRDAVPGQRAIGGGELAALAQASGVLGCILMSTVASWPTAKLVPVRVSSANPCFCPLDLEAPRSAGRTPDSAPRRRLRSCALQPVSTFLIVTATSGRAAPVWFVTTPERLAPVWAHPGNAPIASHKSSKKGWASSSEAGVGT